MLVVCDFLGLLQMIIYVNFVKFGQSYLQMVEGRFFLLMDKIWCVLS